MCPKPNTTSSALSKTSHVEEFEESIPGLFQALMSPEPDPQDRWITFIFPVDYSRKDAAFLEKQIKITASKFPSILNILGTNEGGNHFICSPVNICRVP